MKRTWPTVAYHFNLNRNVTIDEAIRLRENDNRTGDIWCCKNCAKSPTGVDLVAVNRQPNPYFRSSPRSHEKKSCVYVSTMQRKSETYRAAIIIQDMLEWLNNENSNDERRKEFSISKVSFSPLKSVDVVISHDMSDLVTWKETYIMVIDKNRKRKIDPQIKSLILDISRWNDTQLTQFVDAGVRKLLQNWKRLIEREKDKARKKNDTIQSMLNKTEPEEKELTLSEQMKQKLIEENRKQEEERAMHKSPEALRARLQRSGSNSRQSPAPEKRELIAELRSRYEDQLIYFLTLADEIENGLNGNNDVTISRILEYLDFEKSPLEKIMPDRIIESHYAITDRNFFQFLGCERKELFPHSRYVIEDYILKNHAFDSLLKLNKWRTRWNSLPPAVQKNPINFNFRQEDKKWKNSEEKTTTSLVSKGRHHNTMFFLGLLLSKAHEYSKQEPKIELNPNIKEDITYGFLLSLNNQTPIRFNFVDFYKNENYFTHKMIRKFIGQILRKIEKK